MRPALTPHAVAPAPVPTRWWGVVAAGALVSAATAPGQTAGLSPLTDPLIDELGISRTDIYGLTTGFVILRMAGQGT